MDMTINYSIATNDSLVACDSAVWNGNTYYTSGIYIDTLQTSLGCDSVVTMDMTINYSIATNDSLVHAIVQFGMDGTYYHVRNIYRYIQTDLG